MRIAVLSDVHGNIRGLEACLADLDEQGGADTLVAAGDFCLDGPRPVDVLECLRERGARCLRGNTDREIVEFADAAGNGQNSETAEEAAGLNWQCRRLGSSWLRWLRDLPFALRFGDGADGLLIVHANPKNDDEHLWPDADDALLERVTDGVAERTIAFGHLHLPYVRAWRDRLLVDVASAGLPKDGDPRAGYAIFTQRSGGWQVKHRRVVFDVDKVVHDIKQSGMPNAVKRIKVLRRHRYKQLAERIP
ncbi:MAG: metallophosphoesterase family protein [Candidatus Eremiobacteraeota bacterium]|nr:metallophosphoesterase family protein [Candidatus Eremiobacteraeota bacterium]MBC5803896.1 metallophosphoesterase family protein [Candidatus Eremiobacteraeota bacterium]MBC5825152.1 metallophosphoesterase family protein [Candidatus Eremiobacteraeota bacterium]